MARRRRLSSMRSPTVTGDLVIAGGGNVSLPNLTTVEGSIVIEDNASILSLTLPGLTTVSGDLIVDNNPNLTEVTAPNLTIAGDLTVSRKHRRCAIISFDSLDAGESTLRSQAIAPLSDDQLRFPHDPGNVTITTTPCRRSIAPRCGPRSAYTPVEPLTRGGQRTFRLRSIGAQ